MPTRRATATYGRSRQIRITAARRLIADDWSLESDEGGFRTEDADKDDAQVAMATSMTFDRIGPAMRTNDADTTDAEAAGYTALAQSTGNRVESSTQHHNNYSPPTRKALSHASPLTHKITRTGTRSHLEKHNTIRRPLMSKTNSQSVVMKVWNVDSGEGVKAEDDGTMQADSPPQPSKGLKYSESSKMKVSKGKKGLLVPVGVIPRHDPGKENIPPLPSPQSITQRRGRPRAAQASVTAAPDDQTHHGLTRARAPFGSSSTNTAALSSAVKTVTHTTVVSSSPSPPMPSSSIVYSSSTSLPAETAVPSHSIRTRSKRPDRASRRAVPTYNEDALQVNIHEQAPVQWQGRRVKQRTSGIDSPHTADNNISVALDGVTLEESAAIKSAGPDPAIKSALAPLLAACGQQETSTFNTLLDSIMATMQNLSSARDPYTELPQRASRSVLHVRQSKSSALKLVKIGEATYSEVFKVHGNFRDSTPMPASVLKVIPILAHDMRSHTDKDWPQCTTIEDAVREINITGLMGSVDRGFVKMNSARVVCGSYPSCLLQAWDDHATGAKGGSENVRPDCFPDWQNYLVLNLHDGGPDLEASRLTSWLAAASIFFQVTRALASGERNVAFEHRDLHWGNILVEKRSVRRNAQLVCSPSAKLAETAKLPTSSAASLRPVPGSSDKRTHTLPDILDPAVSGVQARVIDFTLSRVLTEDRIIAHSFDDELIFAGEGDIQFEVYRRMRDHTKGDWEGSYPLTNVLWLHYLVNKLLQDKHLRPPAPLTARTSVVPPLSSTARSTNASLPQSVLARAPTPQEARLTTERACYAALKAVRKALEPAVLSVSLSTGNGPADNKPPGAEIDAGEGQRPALNSAGRTEGTRAPAKFPSSARRLMRWAEARLLK